MKREYCMDTKTTVLSKNKTNVVNARQLPVFRAFCKYATLIDEKVKNKIRQTDGGGLFVNVRKGFKVLEKWRNIFYKEYHLLNPHSFTLIYYS
jgi:hypothetical protein